MHTNETKDKFVELRAQGKSLCAIAAELNVSKRTLVDWNQQFRQQIRQLRAVELEALYDSILASRERELTWMAQFEERMVELQLKRGFAWLKDRDVLRYILLYRREIAQLRAEILAPLDEAPVAEPACPVPKLDPSLNGHSNGNSSPPVAPTLTPEARTKPPEWPPQSSAQPLVDPQ
jgi:hypothetical protein